MGKSYKNDLGAAARRHFEAAEHVNVLPHRKDVAGYLYGIAAECALKQIMRLSGMRPLPKKTDDPFYAHFEDLKTMLRNKASGRLVTVMRRYTEKSSFMSNWDITMRYSDGKEIKSAWVERWKQDAKDVLADMRN